METNCPGHKKRGELSVVADMLNRHCEIGLNVDENLCDLIQAAFNCIEARRRRFAASVERLTWHRQLAALEYRIEVLQKSTK